MARYQPRGPLQTNGVMDCWINGLLGTTPASFIKQSNHPSIRSSLSQRLIHFPLVKKPLFRRKRPRVQYPDGTAVRPIHAENPDTAGGQSQIEEPRLNAEPWRVRQQPDGKGIFKRLFNFLLSQRTIHFKGRIIPIKLHNELIVCRTPMQCDYIVFTLEHGFCQRFFVVYRQK